MRHIDVAASFALFASLIVPCLSGCLAISRSESSSTARAEVHIDGAGDPPSCGAEDGAGGGDGAWVVVRSGEVHSELYVEAVVGAASAAAGAGGAAGQQVDPQRAPASPGEPGQAGGVEVTPLDCELDDEPVDDQWVQPMSTAQPGAPCGLEVAAAAGSVVRYGVPGSDDVLPSGPVIVVEEMRVGAGATLAVEGDLTVYAKRFVLESGAVVRSFAGTGFAVLDRETAAAYEDQPGRSGGWLTVVAERAELGGALVSAGNPGAANEPGGDAGRLAVLANELTGVLGAARAFSTRAFDASGGQGGDGLDAAPCD